jgi:YesN/AraC family two-component response regulator
MNVSVKYVSRVFKEKTGMNITDYISQVRISKAKELLLHSDLPIGAIAEKVGIHNRTTFLRTFKKVEGLSPNDFRKSIAADANREAAGIPD